MPLAVIWVMSGGPAGGSTAWPLPSSWLENQSAICHSLRTARWFGKDGGRTCKERGCGEVTHGSARGQLGYPCLPRCRKVIEAFRSTDLLSGGCYVGEGLTPPRPPGSLWLVVTCLRVPCFLMAPTHCGYCLLCLKCLPVCLFGKLTC